MTPTVAPDGLRLVQLPAVPDELVALYEPPDVRPVGHLGRYWIDRSAFKINHAERLLDMELPRLSVRPDTVPIKKAKRRVAGLLKLSNDQSGPQGVDRARRQQHAVARLWLEP